MNRILLLLLAAVFAGSEHLPPTPAPDHGCSPPPDGNEAPLGSRYNGQHQIYAMGNSVTRHYVFALRRMLEGSRDKFSEGGTGL